MNDELKEKLSDFLISLWDMITYLQDCDYAFVDDLPDGWDLIFADNIIGCVDDLNKFYYAVENCINLTQGENNG